MKRNGKIKVLVVDDSAFYRQSIISMLKSSSEIEVIGCSGNGNDAIRFIHKEQPDVITLDLEMPEMDGFTFLRWVMRNNPLPVLVISSESEANNVLKSLELGASEFLPKPMKKASKEIMNLQSDICSKIKSIVDIPLEKRGPSPKRIYQPINAFSASDENSKAKPSQSFRLIALGASTGGPQAIQSILTQIPQVNTPPIVIAQHMPSVFTECFANRLNGLSQLCIKEAVDGEFLEKECVYISPGGFHMIFENKDNRIQIKIKPQQEIDKYVPSIDMMMASAADVLGPKVLGILLTGMGNDGRKGMKRIKEAGGRTVAQNEETAIIFGMPSGAIQEGIVDQVLPLYDIPQLILANEEMDNP